MNCPSQTTRFPGARWCSGAGVSNRRPWVLALLLPKPCAGEEGRKGRDRGALRFGGRLSDCPFRRLGGWQPLPKGPPLREVRQPGLHIHGGSAVGGALCAPPAGVTVGAEDHTGCGHSGGQLSSGASFPLPMAFRASGEASGPGECAPRCARALRNHRDTRRAPACLRDAAGVPRTGHWGGGRTCFCRVLRERGKTPRGAT